MISIIAKVWHGFFVPMIRRPKALQVAALCYRGSGSDMEVLLISSRDTGRWVIPKGWPIRGMKSSEAALQEAWEEAGVRNSKAKSNPIGTYTYDKKLAKGLPVPVTTLVYPVAVKDMAQEFPEKNQRKMQWVSPDVAADLVNETELKSMLRRMSDVFPGKLAQA